MFVWFLREIDMQIFLNSGNDHWWSIGDKHGSFQIKISFCLNRNSHFFIYFNQKHPYAHMHIYTDVEFSLSETLGTKKENHKHFLDACNNYEWNGRFTAKNVTHELNDRLKKPNVRETVVNGMSWSHAWDNC